MPGTLLISSLVSGGLIVNYRCSSGCGHCLYACSSRREPGYIDPETARSNLATVHELGCDSVHIGGGEPFLDQGGLRRVLEVARDVGVDIEYVETNSSWYTDAASARARLRELQDLGLRTLLVSISPFHAEFIPFRKVRGVIEAANDVGLVVFPWIGEFAPEIAGLDLDRRHSLAEFTERYGEDYVPRLIERYSITLGGRAISTFAPWLRRAPVPEVMETAPRRCRRLADVHHFHVDLHGCYVPGLCSGISIRVEDLGAALREDAYPILTRLHGGGVKALFEYASRHHDYRPDTTGYVSACHLCQDIRRFLVVEREVRSIDLGPRDFYRELSHHLRSR